jgi:hypothetical protein
MVQAVISYNLDFGLRLSTAFQLCSDEVNHPIPIALVRQIDVIFHLDARPVVRNLGYSGYVDHAAVNPRPDSLRSLDAGHYDVPFRSLRIVD